MVHVILHILVMYVFVQQQYLGRLFDHKRIFRRTPSHTHVMATVVRFKNCDSPCVCALVHSRVYFSFVFGKVVLFVIFEWQTIAKRERERTEEQGSL